MQIDQTLSFTNRSWDVLYGVIEAEYFQDNEAESIYRALEKKLDFVPFGDYLKRYIYRTAELTGPFREIGEETYREIIVDSFRENGVPPAFGPTTAKLSALARNWLRQQTVGRQVILLLGFGLRMTEEAVNELFLKAIHEQVLNPEDPQEVICAYCYRNGLGFASYERLSKAWRAADGDTSEIRNEGEKELLESLRPLTKNGVSAMETAAMRTFRRLYDEAREQIAVMYNCTGDYSGCSADDITESDLEHVLSSAIPVDRHGNLLPASRSRMSSQFTDRRISRQRLHGLLNGKIRITRYDLITLSFFLWSRKKEVADSPKRRYVGFINATNALLKDCSFGELYVANPYECFILLCLLSEVPLSTYADVWELAYREDAETDGENGN